MDGFLHRTDRHRRFRGLAAGAALIALSACATNPATGGLQLSFFSESDEITLGAEVDRELLATFGEYDHRGLTDYVAEVGARMAAVSERPHLPWTFRIADDEVVNAFALPGGTVYVTRGLLAHLNREAELAGVLGHEIGHVTARHSVHSLSRELAIAAGVMAGLALLDLDDAEAYAAAGLGLLFLKFGRDQERQADQLGVRYAQHSGFDPHGVVDVLRTLQRVSQTQGEGWFPAWLSTHPDPDKRWQRLAAETDLGPPREPREMRRETDAFVERLDGLVYGPDPRNGTLRENVYTHPRDGFRVVFPAGWAIEREGQAVTAQSSAEDALVMVWPQTVSTPDAAARAFAEEEGLEIGEAWDERLGGLGARLVRFESDLDGEPIRGLAAFAQADRRVIAVLAVSSSERWPEHRRALERAVRSVGRLAEGEARGAPPTYLSIVTLDRPMTLREIARQHSPTVEPATLALLNQVELDELLEAGRRVKTLRTP